MTNDITKIIDDNVYIHELVTLGYDIMKEFTDYPDHVQLYSQKEKKFIYLDIEHQRFKMWRLDINGHAPVVISSFIASIIVKALESVIRRDNNEGE